MKELSFMPLKSGKFSHTAIHSLRDCIFYFGPAHGGYFIGNISPARMDLRWFFLGTKVSIFSFLANPEQLFLIIDLRWFCLGTNAAIFSFLANPELLFLITDLRWFCLGISAAIFSFLANPEQLFPIMGLVELRREELVGKMPVKVCYPDIRTHEWQVVKYTRSSYPNGGSWPGINNFSKQ